MTGEAKSALTKLLERGGRVSGNGLSVLRKLGFNGRWGDFQQELGHCIFSDPYTPGLVIVTHPDFEPDNSLQDDISSVDPQVFALCAANYVLGEGDPDDFEPFLGEYSSHTEVITALAVEIDPVIAGVHYPPETEDPVDVYRMERGLVYASGGGQFQIYGAHVLTSINS